MICVLWLELNILLARIVRIYKSYFLTPTPLIYTTVHAPIKADNCLETSKSIKTPFILNHICGSNFICKSIFSRKFVLVKTETARFYLTVGKQWLDTIRCISMHSLFSNIR